MAQRIGITGGTGFLGRHLSRRLLARGHQVVVFTRSPERARDAVPPGVRLEAWDPVETPMPPTWLDPLDAVVNLVGESLAGFLTPAKQRRAYHSRVTATRHLVEGWLQAVDPPRVLLSGSAVGIYGNAGDASLTEASPPGTGFLAGLCRDWEAEAAPVAPASRLVTLRTGLPLHPEGGFLRVLLPVFRWGVGPIFGSGDQWMPWIHLEDWLELVCFALDHEEVTGPLNLTAPAPVRNRELAGALGRALGRPVFLRAPAVLLRATFPKANDLLLSSQRVLPREAEAAGFRFRFPELPAALADLLA